MEETKPEIKDKIVKKKDKDLVKEAIRKQNPVILNKYLYEKVYEGTKGKSMYEIDESNHDLSVKSKIVEHEGNYCDFMFGKNFEEENYKNVVRNFYAYVKYQLHCKLNFDTIWVPLSSKNQDSLKLFTKAENQNQCEIFVSSDFLTNKDKLLVIIQGKGPEKAGIWSFYNIGNSDYYGEFLMKSQVPWAEHFKELGYSVLIMNPNAKKDPFTKENIPEFTSMEDHVKYVWSEVIKKFCPAKKVYVVAHELGCYSFVDCLLNNKNDIHDYIEKVFFIESEHGTSLDSLERKAYATFVKKAVNVVLEKSSMIRDKYVIKSFTDNANGIDEVVFARLLSLINLAKLFFESKDRLGFLKRNSNY